MRAGRERSGKEGRLGVWGKGGKGRYSKVEWVPEGRKGMWKQRKTRKGKKGNVQVKKATAYVRKRRERLSKIKQQKTTTTECERRKGTFKLRRAMEV